MVAEGEDHLPVDCRRPHGNVEWIDF